MWIGGAGMERKVALEVVLKKWVRVSYIKLLTQKTKRGWIQDSILEAKSTTCLCPKGEEEENPRQFLVLF